MHAPLRLATGLFSIALFAVLSLPAAAWGQVTNGVLIDANGVMRLRFFEEPGGLVFRQRVASARAALEQKLGAKSALRKVSLTRLEAAMADAVANNRQFNDAMFHLAGLTRVQYVFYYPETKDIVLAGPAEGWMTDAAGHTIGIESRRPTLLLEDLVVALRAYAAPNARAGVISVSIDPTQAGLQRMQQFENQIGANIRHGDEPMIVQGLRTNLGMQQIVINGVSPKSHFAQVLVEADYRMKLIGIGLEKPAVRITSYVSKARPEVGNNALHRWYFVPNYECVRISDDGLGAELVGDGVKLIGESELVAADGTRHATGQADAASEAFTRSFTQRYGQLAAKAPVYAQMRNCIDLAVAAAQIRAAGWADQAMWQMPIFGSEKAYQVENHGSPNQVEPAINAIFRSGTFSTPIGGGVIIQADLALKSENVQRDSDGRVHKAHADVKPPQAKAGQWWWD